MATPMNNTGNAVGSTDPRDLMDNAQVLDQLINGLVFKYTDRLGKDRRTWSGFEAELNGIIASLDTSNFTFTTIAAGLAATTNGQYFRVIQNPASGLSFVYFSNDSGSATRLTDTPSGSAVTSLMNKASLNDLDASVHDNIIFSGDYKKLVSPSSGTKKIKMRINPSYPPGSVTTQFSNPVFTVSGVAVRSAFLPPDVWVDGDAVQTQDIVCYAAELTVLAFTPGPTVSFMEYSIGRTDNSGLASGLFNAHDSSGTFSPESYQAINSSNKNAVAAYPGGRLKFSVLTADIVAAGLNAASQVGVDTFIKNKLNGLPVFVHAALEMRTVYVKGLGEFVIPAGALSVTLNGYASNNLSLSVYVRKSVRSAEVGSYSRYTADLKNASSLDYDASWPLEVKVSFKPGEVPSAACLLVTDDAGVEYDAQFLAGMHPNPRQKSSVGYWPDGSIRSGSLIFYGALAAGATVFLEIKAYDQPIKTGVSDVKEYFADAIGVSLNVPFAGYTWNFTLQNDWCLNSIRDPAGITTLTEHGFYLAGKVVGSNNSSEYKSKLRPSIRIKQSGAVFVEVEVTVYNSAAFSIPEGVIRHRARYILMKKGRTRILCEDVVQQEIGTSLLMGALNRTNLVPQGGTSLLADNLYKSATWVNPSSGKNWHSAVVRAVGDLHRDGVEWGPYRRTLGSAVSVNATTLRLYAGWEHLSATEESFTRWGFEKGWMWTSELWLNPEADYTAMAPLVSQVYNSPTGFAGVSGYPQVKKREVMQKIQNFLEGSMEYWYSGDALKWRGGNGATRNFRLASLAYDLYRYKKMGIGTLQVIYERFVNYCNSYWGSFLTPGDYYTSGSLVMQYASRMTIPVYQWLYVLAVEEDNEPMMASLKSAMKNYADAMVVQYNKGGGINLQGNVSGRGNSNANAAGFRVLAIAIHMGLDVDGSYLSILQNVEGNLTSATGFMPVQNIVNDNYSESSATSQWLHYQFYAWNNYSVACDLLGRTKAFDMTNYALIASSGEGGFNEIDRCLSESRRGSFNTITFALYGLITSNRASAMNCANSLALLFEKEYGGEPGSPARAFGFSGYQNGSNVERADISFCATTIVDIWFSLYRKENMLI